MLKGILAVEFNQRVQEASARFSIPVDIAEAIGIGDDSDLVLEVRGPRGTLGPTPWRLRSGKEIYGPSLSDVADPGDEIWVRVERPSP
jgi:hypothetical protein